MKAGPAYYLDDRGEVLLERVPVPSLISNDLDAVKERGHVEWRIRDGFVSVRFRPSLISPAAYARLMSWLQGHQPERVLLSYFVQGDWTYEFLRKPGEAARRVRWVTELHGGGGRCNARRRKASLDAMQCPSRWKLAIELWRECRESDPTAKGRLFDQLFVGRWILYEYQAGNSISVCDFGTNQSAHVRKWLETYREKCIADAPDQIFAQTSQWAYHSAAMNGEPRSDETDVIAHWTGHGRHRSQFRRLMLPFKSKDRTWLLSGIQIDAAIDLLG